MYGTRTDAHDDVHEVFCGCQRCDAYWLAVGRGESPQPVTGSLPGDNPAWGYPD